MLLQVATWPPELSLVVFILSNSFSIVNYVTGVTSSQSGDGYVTIIPMIIIPNETPKPSPTTIPCPSESILIIDKGITNISPFQYYMCSNLNKIIFPNTLKSIDIGSFQFCSGLINLTIPINLTEIKEAGFFRCSNLEKLSIF
jgi:hypothetical protein